MGKSYHEITRYYTQSWRFFNYKLFTTSQPLVTRLQKWILHIHEFGVLCGRNNEIRCHGHRAISLFSASLSHSKCAPGPLGLYVLTETTTFSVSAASPRSIVCGAGAARWVEATRRPEPGLRKAYFFGV